MSPIKKAQEKILFSSGQPMHLQVISSQVTRLDGLVYDTQFVQCGTGKGSVCVAFDDAGRLLLRKHWRAALRGESLEFPRGRAMAEESPEDCARRELYEETGLEVQEATLLTKIHGDTGLLRDEVCIVACRVSYPVSSDMGDGEFSSTSWASPEEFKRLVLEGCVSDALTISAFLIWELWQLS